MKTVGIITEYNPFHQGHIYHIQKAKQYGDVLVAICSGFYSQRGLPSLISRQDKTKLALQNGVDVKTVSGMLGHYSAGFTLDTYAHVTTAAQRNAANTMGNVLSCAVR